MVYVFMDVDLMGKCDACSIVTGELEKYVDGAYNWSFVTCD